jgi:hypothetical protein
MNVEITSNVQKNPQEPNKKFTQIFTGSVRRKTVAGAERSHTSPKI